MYLEGRIRHLRPVSFSEASLILYGRPCPVRMATSCDAGLSLWGQPHPVRSASSCEAVFKMWGRHHTLRLASSFKAALSHMTGALLRGCLYPLRLAITCDAGLIKIKCIKDCQHFGLTTGAWPQTVGYAVAHFMSAWTLLTTGPLCCFKKLLDHYDVSLSNQWTFQINVNLANYWTLMSI